MNEDEPLPASEFADAYDDALATEARRPSDAERLRSAILEQSLGALPRHKLVTVDAQGDVRDAVEVMNRRGVGCALVLERAELVGIFTERDLLRRVIGQGLRPERTPLRDVMTPDPATLPSAASLAFALNKMSVEGYRHLPLVDDEGRLVNVVSQRDVVDWIVELLPTSALNLPFDPSPPRTRDGG